MRQRNEMRAVEQTERCILFEREEKLCYDAIRTSKIIRNVSCECTLCVCVWLERIGLTWARVIAHLVYLPFCIIISEWLPLSVAHNCETDANVAKPQCSPSVCIIVFYFRISAVFFSSFLHLFFSSLLSSNELQL